MDQGWRGGIDPKLTEIGMIFGLHKIGRQAASETESSMSDLALKNGLEMRDAQWSGRAQTH